MTGAAIPAATVLLLRDAPRFEVLMIARHKDSSFAGGALVFPGGRVDPGDRHPEWRTHARGLAPEPLIAAAQVAAIREAFEETGVVLAYDDTGAMASGAQALLLHERRRGIEKGQTHFLDFVRAEKLTLACDALHLFAHWTAPPNLHKRFDTLFFAARFPEGQQALEDGDEATEALWIAPAAAVEARTAGQRRIIFPTARNLELLALSLSAGEVFALAAKRPIRSVTPQVVSRNGESFLTIPDDLSYPVTEEKLETATRI